MPLYEFECEQCGKEFEDLVSDGEQPACPHCGSRSTRKLLSACCRNRRGKAPAYGAPAAGGGCGGCSGGNCGACGR